MHVVRYLIEIGADVDVRDRYDNTPIVDAVRHKHDEVVRLLRNAGATMELRAVGPMLCACAAVNDVAGLKRLVESSADINIPDYDNRTALHLACSNGCIEAVEYLLSIPGINVTPEDRYRNTPLVDAIRHHHKDVQALLRAAGSKLGEVDIDIKLNFAAESNDLETLQTLYTNGADFNKGDSLMRTPLHVAASHGCVESVSWMSTLSDVDVNAMDAFGMTPLDDAVSHNQAVVVVLLELRGALRADHPTLAGRYEERQRELTEMRRRMFEEKVELLLSHSSEYKLQKAAVALRENFDEMSRDLRASLNSFVQTQRAIFLARLLGTDNPEEIVENDDETTVDERTQQLERLAGIIKFRLNALQEMLKADKIEQMVQSKVAKKIEPRLCKAIVFAREAAAKLAQLMNDYMAEGKTIGYDFERVRRDMGDWTEPLLAEIAAQNNAAQAAMDAAAAAASATSDGMPLLLKM